MNIGYVYKIVSPSGKIYVGSTIRIKKRIYEYSILSCKNQSKLYESLNKYGFSNHSFEILWEGHAELRYKYEREFGFQFKVLDKISGLNLKLPDDNGNPSFVSDEVKKKISDKAKIRNIGVGNPFFGKKHSQELKDKLSMQRKDAYLGEDNPNFGKKWTDEQKQAQSTLVKSKGYRHTDQFKNDFVVRMRECSKLRRGKKLSTDHISKLGHKRGENVKAKLVFNIENGIFYDCITDAAESMGVKRERLKYFLLSAPENKTSIRYA